MFLLFFFLCLCFDVRGTVLVFARCLFFLIVCVFAAFFVLFLFCLVLFCLLSFCCFCLACVFVCVRTYVRSFVRSCMCMCYQLNNDEVIDSFHRLNDHPPLSPPMSEVSMYQYCCSTSCSGVSVVVGARVPESTVCPRSSTSAP